MKRTHEDSDSMEYFSVINAFDIPKLSYNPDRKTFLP